MINNKDTSIQTQSDALPNVEADHVEGVPTANNTHLQRLVLTIIF
jgi:hypothetical protein